MTINIGFFLFNGVQPLDFVGPWVRLFLLFLKLEINFHVKYSLGMPSTTKKKMLNVFEVGDDQALKLSSSQYSLI